jgi:hypothetical protein
LVPSKDFAEGKGRDPFGAKCDSEGQVLDADPTTDAARGSLVYKANLGDFEGEVTCLRVDGRNAAFSGEITKSSIPALEQNGAFFVEVSDSGRPEGEVDHVKNVVFVTPGDPQCSTPTTGGSPIEKGDIADFDAPRTERGASAPSGEPGRSPPTFSRLRQPGKRPASANGVGAPVPALSQPLLEDDGAVAVHEHAVLQVPADGAG